MIKIIEIKISEILFDAGACSEMITHACCKRKSSWQIKGLSSDDSAILIIAESAPSSRIKKYQLAPLPGLNNDEIIAEIKSRYYNGFTTVGSFMTADGRYALFAETDIEHKKEAE